MYTPTVASDLGWIVLGKDDSATWLLAQVKPNQLARAEENLARQGFDPRMPRLRKTVRRGSRSLEDPNRRGISEGTIMAGEPTVQLQSRAADDFNTRENRDDGLGVVRGLADGLTLLKNLAFQRVHHDVESAFGVDSMLIPVSAIAIAAMDAVRADIARDFWTETEQRFEARWRRLDRLSRSQCGERV